MRVTTAIAIFAFAGIDRAFDTAAAPPSLPVTSETIYNFPSKVLPENIHLRSDGQLLVTSATDPQIFQLDPSLDATQQARVVHTFSGYGSVTGIVEIKPDVFLVAVGNFTLAGGSTPGTWGIWQVDLRQYTPPCYNSSSIKVQHVASSPQASFFDGVALIDGSRGLVAANDFDQGSIWLVDVQKNETSAIVTSPLLLGVNGTSDSFSAFGVNGLKYADGVIYFTNTGKDFYGSVAVDPNTGKAAGELTTVFNYTIHLDDFDIAPSGNTYLTTSDTPDGGILLRKARTPIGQNGTRLVVSKFGTNSVVAQDYRGGCRVLFTAGSLYQVERAFLPGAC